MAGTHVFGDFAGGEAVLRRGLTTAPPRVSIRPAAPPIPAVAGNSATTGAPAPANVARAAAGAATGAVTAAAGAVASAATNAAASAATASPAKGREQVYSEVAALFRSFNSDAPVPGVPNEPTSQRGTAMTRPAIRRALSDDPTEADGQLEDSAPLEPDLDDIVDRVVERIEQRVIDELERRGRRANPGVF